MNRVVHFEIPADDPKRAIDFYSEVFGWKITEWDNEEAEYYLIETGPDNTPGINGGLMRREEKPKGGDSGYICTIAVSSVDEIAEKIKNAKGKLITEKMEVPNIGWMYYCRDTEGNKFGIMEMMQKEM